MKKLLFVTCISIILLSSCDWLFDVLGGGTKTFWAVDNTKNYGDPNYFYQLTADLLAENDYCKVYVERGTIGGQSTADKVAAEYINIYNKMLGAFGIDFDVKYNNGTTGKLNTIKLADAYSSQPDGKLTILLLDIRDGYKEGENDSYVAGYFYAVDFYTDNRPELYRSNECDMIYIDTDPALKKDPADAYSTLAHELQHMMNFITSNEKRIVYDDKDEPEDVILMDTWVNEGLSSAAEYIYTDGHKADRYGWYYYNGSGPDDKGDVRIKSLIDRGNNFFVWNNRDHDDTCGGSAKCNNPDHSQYAVLDDYATVYLFFQWLRIQNNGTGIYKDIISSKYGDYHAVTDAIGAPYKNNWGLLLRDWLAANYIYDSTGTYGYKNDFDFRKGGELLSLKGRNLFSTNAQSVNLYPGEGVFSKIDSAYAGSKPVPTDTQTIKYSILTTAPGNSMAQGALLTYNVSEINYNTYNDDGTIKAPIAPSTGTITGVVANVDVADPVNGRSVASPFRTTGPYRIGIGDVRRGWFRDFPLDGVLQLQNSLTLRE